MRAWPCLIACMLLGACSAAVSKTASSREDMRAEQARSAVRVYHLAPGTKSACLAYAVNLNASPGVDEVDVLEVHNKACGGDPGLEPRRFGLYFDQHKDQIAIDDAADGSMRFLKK